MGRRLTRQICLRFMLIFALVLGGILLLFHFGFYSLQVHSIGRSVESAFSYFQTLDLAKIIENGSTYELDEDAYGDNLHFILMDENYVPILYNDPADPMKAPHYDYSREKDKFLDQAKAVFEEGENGDQVILKGRITSAGTPYYIVLYRRTTWLHRYIRYAETVLINVLIGLWFIASILLLIIVRRRTFMLNDFSEEISSIINGDYTRRIDTKLPYEEYTEAANRINDLAERLYRGKGELENYRYLLRTQTIVDTEEINRQREAVAIVTHQLKTPLAIISSQLELGHEETDPEKKEYYFQSIMEEIDKLSLLISEILRNATERGASGAAFYPRNISVTDLLDELAPKYESWLRSQGIEFVSEISRNVYAEADPFLLEQVVHNYMTNACKHTKTGKTIRLRLLDEGELCTIRVHNEGDGIPEVNRDHLWEMYYQGPGEENRMDVGLGLYVVRDIMLMHGGRYGAVDDETGVEFYVSFFKRLPGRTETGV